MANFKPAKLDRTKTEPLANLLPLFILENNLFEGLYNKAVCDAWGKMSGASKYTVDTYVKGKLLYVTLSSSVARNSLLGRKEEILRGVNEEVAANEILSRCGNVPALEDIRMH